MDPPDFKKSIYPKPSFRGWSHVLNPFRRPLQPGHQEQRPRLHWPKLGAAVATLAFLAYASLAGGAWFFVRHHQRIATVGYLDLLLPTRWSHCPGRPTPSSPSKPSSLRVTFTALLTPSALSSAKTPPGPPTTRLSSTAFKPSLTTASAMPRPRSCFSSISKINHPSAPKICSRFPSASWRSTPAKQPARRSHAPSPPIR